MSHAVIHIAPLRSTELSLVEGQCLSGGEAFLFPHYTTLDSLRTHAVSPYREVDAATLYGSHSEQAAIPLPAHHTPLPTASCGYGLLVLLLLGLYAALLYRHMGDVGVLLTRVFRVGASGERLQEDSGSSFSRFLNICGWLGVGALAAAVVRFVAPVLALGAPSVSLEWDALLWTLLLLGALLVVVLYQVLITMAIGALTFSQHLIEQLWMVKRLLFAFMTLLCMPTLLLFLPTPASKGTVWLWVILIELVISLILYLHETRALFISKKISKLHWILYLCTVEIFPFSLLWLLAERFA